MLMYWGTKYKPLCFIFLLKGRVARTFHHCYMAWLLLVKCSEISRVQLSYFIIKNMLYSMAYGTKICICSMLAFVWCVKSVDGHTFSSCIRVLLGRDSRHAPPQHLSRLFLISNKCMCFVTYQEEKSSNSHPKGPHLYPTTAGKSSP